MVPMVEACAECTQNCLLMHKKDKNPSPVATTFFKVMFGDKYSEVMFLPPKFARSVRNMVGKETWLEDSSGEKWTVKFTRVDGLLAFEEGWNRFSLDHGLMVGDFLVFHYIMESHFVVLMYGTSGCPELRHFGIKKTREKRKLIADDHIPSNVNANGHHCSNESSSQSARSVYGVKVRPEIRHSGGTQHKKEIIEKQKSRIHTTIPSIVNTANAHLHSSASPSRPGPSNSGKGMSQRSKPLVGGTNPDNMDYETHKTVKQFCLVDRDTGNVEDEYRSSCLHDVPISEIHRDESDGGWKNNVPVGGGGAETQNNESGKVLETRTKESTEKPKASTPMLSDIACNFSIKSRLRNATPPIKKADKGKKEVVGTSDKGNVVEASNVTWANMAKKEPIWASNADTLGSGLHNFGCISAPPGIFLKPMAKPMEMTKTELTFNRGSDGGIRIFSGCNLEDTRKGCLNSLKKEDDDILPNVKPEPVDYDEAPSHNATNASFSAVMSSYQYLELPDWLKLHSKVILLRNGGNLWPVLCQNKMGLKALTQSWEAYATERGIQPGDKCEFVLESLPDGPLTCSVYIVHVTRT